MRARGRTQVKRGTANKLEERYRLSTLEGMMAAREIVWYRFEGIKLRLADSTFYTPDFAVQTTEGFIEFHEVKGFWESDARVKIKVAADQYPMFKFIAIRWDKRDGWVTEDF